MYHYMHIDPYLIKERHERMCAEASKRRLVSQLRKHHEGSSQRLLASFLRPTSILHRLRGTGAAEQ